MFGLEFAAIDCDKAQFGGAELTGWHSSLSPSQTWTSQWSHTVETFSSRWKRKEWNLKVERLSLAFSKIVTVLSEGQLLEDEWLFTHGAAVPAARTQMDYVTDQRAEN